jgi:RNase P/RNase MRP subunit POP5
LKRIKRRYIAMRLECEGLPSEREFMDAIWTSVTKLYGEVGASLTGLTLINFDGENKIFVIRTSLASLPMVRASVATVTDVAGKFSSLNVLFVSGTLKALYANVG